MEWIRLIHIDHFDVRRQRFTSLAFKNSSDVSGASIIGLACVDERGVEVCEHIAEFYAGTASDPAIFWVFDDAILPPDNLITQQDSPSGDKCHYNLLDVPDAALRRIIIGVPIPHMRICDRLGARALSFDDLPQPQTE
jgi:hypothetical protein